MAHFDFRDPSRPIKIPFWKYLKASLRVVAHRLFPLTWSLRISIWLARLHRYRKPHRRDAVEALLKDFLPPDITPRELRHVGILSRAIGRMGGRTYAPVCCRSRKWLLRTLQPEGLQHLDDIKRSGSGVIIVITHVGPHSWVAPVLRQLGFPMRLTQRRRVAVDQLVLLRWQGLVSQVLPFPDDPEGGLHLKRLHDLIKAGEWIPHVGDSRASENGLRGKLLWREICCPRAPWALGRLTGVPLVPVLILMDRDFTFHLIVAQPIRVARAGAPAEEAMQAAFQDYLRFVESRAAEMPWNGRPMPQTA